MATLDQATHAVDASATQTVNVADPKSTRPALEAKSHGLGAVTPPEDNANLSYKIAKSEAEKTSIYELRKQIWEEDFPYLLQPGNGSHPAKDGFDDHSWLYYCRNSEQTVGSCRCSPMVEGQWEISSSLPKEVRLNFDPAVTVQLEKVYIRSGYRNSCLHEFLFYHFSNWMLENTAYTRYFAVCNAGLVRLYRRLGARLALPHGIRLRGRAAHTYYVLEGGISDFNAIIKKTHSIP